MAQDISVIVVRLPRTFYRDHLDRELPSGSPKKWLKRQVDVELTREEYAEVLSDARHYAGEAMSDWTGDYARSVRQSAKATVKRLEMYGPEDFKPRKEMS